MIFIYLNHIVCFFLAGKIDHCVSVNIGSAEKMMGQATTMELLYTQTKLNVKSKASDLGGLIYIRPGMARG